MVKRRKILQKLGNAARSAARFTTPIIRQAAKNVTQQMVNKAIAGMAGAATPAPKQGKRRPAALMNAPSAFGSTVHTGSPNLRGSAGSSRITHSEYIGDVAARDPANFDLQYQFGINPGNQTLMPWASKVAGQFDSYVINSLRFRYMPLCGTQTQGVVVIAVDYDASDPPPTSLQQMLTYKNSVQTNAWKPVTHSSAGGDLHKLKSHFVLTGVPPPNTDIKTYDVGNLYVAVNAVAATGALGQLFVDYDITLSTPQTVLDPPSVGARANITGSATTQNIGTLSANNLLGPMGAYFDDQGGEVYDVYVPVPGYYTFNLILLADADFSHIAITSSQGPALISQPVTGTDNYAFTLQFQVINPDSPALSFNGSVTGIGGTFHEFAFEWVIQPLSDTLVSTSTLMPVTSLMDARRRFGKTPRPVP